jgi:hypothetical protein
MNPTGLHALLVEDERVARCGDPIRDDRRFLHGVSLHGSYLGLAQDMAGNQQDDGAQFLIFVYKILLIKVRAISWSHFPSIAWRLPIATAAVKI